ncbi:helix-turn-helix domain-containing protein [Halomonas eurihalina]|uniref:Helix-turn-helix domain-containing protein n=1 Tax=Halomonas eurihalina TaxID=42566 RepID=A0A5D9DDF2_HALER|nr:helix-turn-helix transcriptional regulator [Halomonas eurihalina]MDR5858187.1 helix-turn-helix domain-containing protein [Halomonas eurihalina]TZG41312.1 helix-turn-helix domain-containing protein [Halomonas eurihalina]
MPRRKPTDEEKRRMWAAISKAAMDYHDHHQERGLGVLIADDAGVKAQSVSDWKSLKTAPSDKILIRLASKYGVSAAELAGEDAPTQAGLATDEALRLAGELTSTVTKAALPEGSVEQFSSVMEKAHELVLQGKGEDEAYGILFRYALSIREQAPPSE